MATRDRPTKAIDDDSTGSSRVDVVTARGDSSTQEALVGTDDSRRTTNVSWGLVFAGITAFLALVVTLSMASAAMASTAPAGPRPASSR